MTTGYCAAPRVGYVALTCDFDGSDWRALNPQPWSPSTIRPVFGCARWCTEGASALLVIQGGHYQFALESDFDASIQRRPHESVGFVPAFADPRVHVVEFEFDRPVSPRVSRHTRDVIADVDRVVVYSGSHVFTTEFVATQEPVLRSERFRKRATFAFGAEIVWIWEKSLDRAPDR
jgi:hypothetical protein